MIEQNELYSLAFQNRLLAHLVRSPGECRRIMTSGKIDQCDFDSPPARIVLSAARIFFTTVCPSAIASNEEVDPDLLVPIISGMVREGIVRREEIHPVESLIDEIYELQLAPDIYSGMVNNFIRHQQVRREMNKAFASGQVSERDFINRMKDIERRTSMEEDDTIVSITDEEIDNALPTTYDVVPTGIDSIDAMLDGGMLRQKLGMIVAYTGRGKTALGLNFCWRNASGNGSGTPRKAVFITLEIPKGEVIRRYLAMTLRYDYTKIAKSGEDEHGNSMSRLQINDEVKELLARRKREDIEVAMAMNNFRVLDYSTKPCTPDAIRSDFNKLIDAGFHPDIGVMDYIDLLRLSGDQMSDMQKFSKKDSRKDELGVLSKSMEEIAIDYNMAMWVTSQSNDEGAKKSMLYLTSNRDSRQKNDPVSVWLGIGATANEKLRGIFTINCDKHRDGRTFNMKLKGELRYFRYKAYDENEELEEEMVASSARVRVRTSDSMSRAGFTAVRGGEGGIVNASGTDL